MIFAETLPLRSANSTLCAPNSKARGRSPRTRVSSLRLLASVAAFRQSSWAMQAASPTTRRDAGGEVPAGGRRTLLEELLRARNPYIVATPGPAAVLTSAEFTGCKVQPFPLRGSVPGSPIQM